MLEKHHDKTPDSEEILAPKNFAPKAELFGPGSVNLTGVLVLGFIPGQLLIKLNFFWLVLPWCHVLSRYSGPKSDITRSLWFLRLLINDSK